MIPTPSGSGWQPITEKGSPMTARETLRTPLLALVCALTLLAMAVPAAGDCLPCFNKPPDWCGGTGNDSYSVPANGSAAGNDGDDHLFGHYAGNEKICGNQDVDSIWGSNGNDYVIGNGGNDSVSGDTGNDFVAGGNGHDYLWGSSLTGNYDTLDGGPGTDRCYYGDVYTGCEYINP